MRNEDIGIKYPTQSQNLVNYGDRIQSSHPSSGAYTNKKKKKGFLLWSYSSAERWKAKVLITYLNKHTLK